VGASSARESVMSFRNDEQVQVLSDLLNTPEHPEWFTTVVFECPAEVAMSWDLSEVEMRHMEQGFRPGSPNAKNLQRLKEWWKKAQ
jgi:hypothetical protein